MWTRYASISGMVLLALFVVGCAGTPSGNPPPSDGTSPSGPATTGGGGNSPLPLPDGVIGVRQGATGAANGRTWTDAFPDLQPAIAAALVPGNTIREIWVAQGTYKPAGPGGDRTTSFSLVNDVTIYGGFAGTESQLADRNITANLTILSGDLNGNDSPNQGNRDDNSVTVIVISNLSATAVLDGFTITAGNAPFSSGAGLIIGDGSATFRNCTFTDNSASVQGGAVAILGTGNPLFVACTFRGNRAGDTGGAIVHFGNTVDIRDSQFIDNTATAGGAIRTALSAAATVANCTFTGNSAQAGGAVWIDAIGSTLTNCTFQSNSANFANGSHGGSGGAVLSTQPVTLADCIFHQNTTDQEGGAIKDSSNGLALAGCLFDRNQATFGGGVSISSSTQPFINCTFSGNSAINAGGGIFIVSNTWSIANSIFWGNTLSAGASPGSGSQIFLGDTPKTPDQLQFSDVQDLDAQFARDGNIKADPLFVDTASGDLHLKPGSPCINKGSNTLVPSSLIKDLDGTPRIQGSPPVVDMGAYEQ
jgi:hypothetical protein